MNARTVRPMPAFLIWTVPLLGRFGPSSAEVSQPALALLLRRLRSSGTFNVRGRRVGLRERADRHGPVRHLDGVGG